jgi:pimeloyl-ACP methyl ester carboxylesterase
MQHYMLHYQIYQNDQNSSWLVFLHGAGGNTYTWKKQLAFLKPHFNILTLDLRDHGNSKNLKPDYEQYTFDIICSDIERVLNSLGIEKAHFVTLSFGSVLLQALSLRNPDLIKSAVFAGGIFKGTWAIRVFVQLARFFNLILPYKWMYQTFSWLLMPKKHHQQSRRIYARQAEKLSSQEYMKWVGLYGEFFNAQLPFPTLTIMGTEDYVFLNGAKAYSARHRTNRLALLPNAGHICNIDQYQEFNGLALQFLIQVEILENRNPHHQAHTIKSG